VEKDPKFALAVYVALGDDDRAIEWLRKDHGLKRLHVRLSDETTSIE